MDFPRVSIVITAHNYAKYLPKSLESALAQNYDNLEIVVVNDGSTDNTEDVLKAYTGDSRVKVLTLPGVGLAAASNRGIEASSGDFIVRLDADDWFDENIAIVLSNYLQRNPAIGMVFCDYFTVDAHGEIIEGVQRGKVNDEIKLLDRPCLAAGAMYRRSCWDSIGGYNEELRYQEDYDFWIRFIERFAVRNVSLPLMYYRQHGSSMSRNWEGRMSARRFVKERFVKAERDGASRRIMAVVPAPAEKFGDTKLPLLPLGDRTLLENTLHLLDHVEAVDRVIVSTDDPAIAQISVDNGGEVPFLRSKQFNNPSVSFEAVLDDLLRWMKEHQAYSPDYVVILHPNSPFISKEHVAEAIDTMLLYDTDSVVGVVEDLTYHWKIGADGLEPVGYKKRVVRQDKNLVFKEAGGLYMFKAENLSNSLELLGKRIGHIELAPYDTIRIRSPYEYWLARKVMENGREWLKS